MILSFFYIFVFVIGLLFYVSNPSSLLVEPFESEDKSCPNILFKQGTEYLLQNTRKIIVPGVNPIKFNNLQEYEEFVKWQRSQNIKCPILYLEHAYSAQGHPVYFVSPNPPFSANESTPRFTPRFKQELCESANI